MEEVAHPGFLAKEVDWGFDRDDGAEWKKQQHARRVVDKIDPGGAPGSFVPPAILKRSAVWFDSCPQHFSMRAMATSRGGGEKKEMWRRREGKERES